MNVNKISKYVYLFLKKAQTIEGRSFEQTDIRDALRGIVTDVNNLELLHPKYEAFINRAYDLYNANLNNETVLGSVMGDYTITVTVTPANNVDIKLGDKVVSLFGKFIPQMKSKIQEYLKTVPVKNTVSLTIGEVLQ